MEVRDQVDDLLQQLANPQHGNTRVRSNHLILNLLFTVTWQPRRHDPGLGRPVEHTRFDHEEEVDPEALPVHPTQTGDGDVEFPPANVQRDHGTDTDADRFGELLFDADFGNSRIEPRRPVGNGLLRVDEHVVRRQFIQIGQPQLPRQGPAVAVVDPSFDALTVDRADPGHHDGSGLNPDRALPREQRVEPAPLFGRDTQKKHARRVRRQLRLELVTKMPLNNDHRQQHHESESQSHRRRQGSRLGPRERRDAVSQPVRAAPARQSPGNAAHGKGGQTEAGDPGCQAAQKLQREPRGTRLQSGRTGHSGGHGSQRDHGRRPRTGERLRRATEHAGRRRPQDDQKRRSREGRRYEGTQQNSPRKCERLPDRDRLRGQRAAEDRRHQQDRQQTHDAADDARATTQQHRLNQVRAHQVAGPRPETLENRQRVQTLQQPGAYTLRHTDAAYKERQQGDQPQVAFHPLQVATNARLGVHVRLDPDGRIASEGVPDRLRLALKIVWRTLVRQPHQCPVAAETGEREYAGRLLPRDAHDNPRADGEAHRKAIGLSDQRTRDAQRPSTQPQLVAHLESKA